MVKINKHSHGRHPLRLTKKDTTNNNSKVKVHRKDSPNNIINSLKRLFKVEDQNMYRENLEVVLQVRQLFDETDNKDSLYQDFADNGIDKEQIDEILTLSEDEVTAAVTDVIDKEEEQAEIISLMEARKIASAAVNAFLNKRLFNGQDGRTKVHLDDQGAAHYSYRGNVIATHHPDGKITGTLAGWPSSTTRNHLNHIAGAIGAQRFGQKKGSQYHGSNPVGARDHVTLREDFDPETDIQSSIAQQIMAAIINDKPADAQVLLNQAIVNGLNDYVDQAKENMLMTPEVEEQDEEIEYDDEDDDYVEEGADKPGGMLSSGMKTSVKPRKIVSSLSPSKGSLGKPKPDIAKV